MDKAILLGLACFCVTLWGQSSRERYLLIDLSGGPKASKYAFRFSEKGPDISQKSCRTTELWLRQVPAGTFMMGSPAGESERYDNEELHRVTLTKPFYIGVFEVTQKQWKLVMGSNPSYYKSGDDHPVEQVIYKKIRGEGSKAGGGWPEYGHKVDAGSFLGKLQAKTGLLLDLPTEAQWEYACRAGVPTALNSGRNLTNGKGRCPNLDEVGRYNENRPAGVTHARVGSYQPNAWGLYDMHGNVWEWCLDWYQRKLGTVETIDPWGPQDGYARTLRGGSWIQRASGCRSAVRNGYNRDNNPCEYGFRVVFLEL